MAIEALARRPAGTINLIGGRLCLDFVNTIGARRLSAQGELTIRDEKLNSFLDLVAWGHHAAALSAAEAVELVREAELRPYEAARILDAAISLRETIYRILRSTLEGRRPSGNDISALNAQLEEARRQQRLGPAGKAFAWGWRAPQPSLNKVLWAVGLSAGQLLTEDDLSRLRQCGGDDCGWIFLDASRNRSRHWCDMRDCGNRDRVRQFRIRQQRKTMGRKPR